MSALITDLGGESGFGEQFISRNDDSYSGVIDLTSIFGSTGLNFYGTTYTSLVINNNGNVVFGTSGESSFTPWGMQQSGKPPMIAAFFADVDTRGGAVTATPGGTSTGSNLVWYDLDSTGFGTLTVTWDDVGYYRNNTDKLNAFQLRLIGSGNGGFEVQFRYEDVNWTTGSASGGSGGLGGTPAVAGFTAGDGSNFYQLSQSSNQARLLGLESTPGNTGVEGFYRFQIVSGTDNPEVITGTDGNDILSGAGGNDTIHGLEGNDLIDGQGGSNSLVGGLGDDTYILRSDQDIMVELAGQGIDTIQTGESFSLDDFPNIENISLTGSAGINATGNAANNTLISNAGDNRLDGQGGSDTASYVNATAAVNVSLEITDTPQATAGSGSDTLISIENLMGSIYADQLTGSAADNVLTGGTGADILTGGAGNDTYGVDNSNDVLVELAGGGEDMVQSSIGWTLVAEFEHLALIGEAAINGVGNAVDNRLMGNDAVNTLEGLAGNDTLDGGLGADTLVGGTGDDVYVVQDSTDVVTELAGEGTDMIRSTVSYTASANVEKLTLLGLAANATGNDLANILTGGIAGNVLDGGLGADTLVGGAGDDVYVIDQAGDLVYELAGEGTDLIQSAISHTVSANVENLTLTGSAALIATGNELANVLIGNTANNVLDGRGSADTLIGGVGDDLYTVDNAGDVVIELSGEGFDLIQSAISYTASTDVERLTLTGSAAVNATGNVLANVLTGNTGNNILDGQAGADTMIGGAGSDIYTVDNAGDVVNELTGEGSDLIQSAISYTASANVENLTLTGSAAVNAIGNDLANVLTGNTGNNTLDGQVGADTLVGGAGDDRYTVDNASDVVTELSGEGADLIQSAVSYTASTHVENLTLTGSVALIATGNDLANVLTGNTANNVLDGRGGADTLIGGAGDDLYTVDNVGDVVTELTNEGTDLIQSAISYTASTNVEKLTLTGTSAIDATGNDLANVLTGNTANNRLDGGLGADTLVGGAGDDRYTVDNASDVVTELSGEGADLIQSAVSYTASAHVENLTLTGSVALIATGNDLANVLTGNTANNVLDGRGGADTLIGGAGDDLYTVDNVGDVVTELTNEGTDLIQSAISYTASTNVEKLTLTGTSAIDATGNTLDNVLAGNANGNLLDGAFGADTMAGGAGNDTYVVDQSGDRVVELANEGLADLIRSSVTFTASAHVENLTLTGSATVNAIGNELANSLIGNTAANTFTGGIGADSMLGGAGNDTYLFSRGDGQDTIRAEEDTSVNRLETLTFTAGILPTEVKVRLVGTALELSINGTTDKVTIEGFFVNSTASSAWNPIQQVVFAGPGVTWNLATLTDLAIAITGTTGNDTLTGTTQSDKLFGLAGNDNLSGLAGNDTLDGGAGNDKMSGGAGNDTYLVDVGGDAVTEQSGEGTDTIVSSVSYTTSANVENLTLSGSAATNATGNILANVLTGNASANVLNGQAGADTLIGGAGNDVYVVDVAGDVVTERADEGTDLIQSAISYTTGANVENLTLTGRLDINATGNAVANVLTGNGGANVLDGSTGNDTMAGGLGNDTYLVDATGDVVNETTGQGTDRIVSSVSYTASTNVENLTLTGSAALDATGNALANVLTGNSGANVLSGLAGADTLIGGAGDDTYIVDVAGDVVTELTGEGNDLIQSSVSYTASTYVENLTLTGTTAINATGNGLNNVLTGNAGVNTLDGRLGNDSLSAGAGNDVLKGGVGADFLTGGAGSDMFVFAAGDSVLNVSGTGGAGGLTGFDTLIDFSLGWLIGAQDKVDTIGTPAVVANTAGVNGADSTLTIAGQFVKSHAIVKGMVTFDDTDTYSSALTLGSMSDVAAVVQYLQANDLGNAGASVAFDATTGGIVHTFLFTQGDNAGTNNLDVLVDLVGVNANGVTTSSTGVLADYLVIG